VTATSFGVGVYTKLGIVRINADYTT